MKVEQSILKNENELRRGGINKTHKIGLEVIEHTAEFADPQR